MNKSVICYILGYVLRIEAFLLMIPCLVAIIYREPAGFAFLISAFLCLLPGIIMSRKKPSDFVFYLKEGCIATSLSWIALSVFGCLPFVISHEIPSFTNALFETISGFTTTGASILYDVEQLSHCIIFWRSFTHWIGGMGVLVFLLAIVPLSGGSHINLMRAESPGPSVGKLVPKVKYTARILYLIYLGLTIIQFFFLIAGGMTIFDAVTTSMGTAGTGGFGIKNDSMAGYSPYIQWVTTIFMILFGVNFNAYYLILYRKFKNAFKMEEVRYYFLIIAAATTIIFFNILHISTDSATALRDAAFQVASIITTTGFSTVDFNKWPELSRSILILLMFTGACAGSTCGGIKVSRFIIAVRTAFREFTSYIHPKSIKKITMDDKPVDSDIIHSVCIYFITFAMLFTVSLLLLSVEGKDFTTNFTAVAATINNIGPGLEMVGPTQNFCHFSILSKYVLMFDMLAGRLELFPLLILLQPAVWKDMISGRKTLRKKIR